MTGAAGPEAGVRRWVGAVVAMAAAAGALTVAFDGGRADLVVAASLTAGFGLTLAFPLRMSVGGEVEGLEFQEALIVPALLLLPGRVTIVAFAVATAIAMAARRRGLLRGAFNVAQWTVAVALADAVFHLLPGDRLDPTSPGAFAAAAAAVLAGAVWNVVAVGVAISRSTGQAVADVLRGGHAARLALWTSNVALGALVTVVGDHEPNLMPVAVVPAVFFHLAYRAMAERRADGIQLQRLGEAEAAVAAAGDPEDVAAELARRAHELLHTRGARVEVTWPGGDVSASAGDPDDAAQPSWGPGALRRDVDVAADVRLTVQANARSNLDPHGEREHQVLDALVRRGAATLARLRLFDDVVRERRLVTEIVSSSSDGIFSVDDDQRVQSWNPAMERITGFAADDVVGGRCFTVFRARDAEGRDICPSACPGRCGTTDAVSVQVSTGAGEQRWLMCTYSPMPDGGYVVVARDVTAHKEVEDLKADFLSTVSHELQTPLTPIKGFLGTLLRDDAQFSEEDRRRFYDMMYRQADRLERLVKDLLLATSLMDRDQLFLPEAVGWDAAVSEVVDLYRRQEPDRDFVVDVPPGLPPVVADPQRGEQVLSNIIANAVKYSPAGTPVRVTVRAAGDHVLTTVADRGPGVPPRDRERIFERFTRLGDHLTRPVGGAGLGLFIARRLVEAMGGTITVDAAPEGGAAFTFSLPVWQGARNTAG